MPVVGIVDYKIVNIGSVYKAVSQYANDVKVVTSPFQLDGVDKLILPGVGAFGRAAEQIRRMGLWDGIIGFIKGKQRPFLGICLGMQLLFSESEEAPNAEGFNILPSGIVRFNMKGIRCPHMGWNTIDFQRPDPLFDGLDNQFYTYFCHSYYFPVSSDSKDIILGITEYGAPFSSAVRQGNIWAVQFHPEKSQKNGLKIIENFVRLCK